MALLVSRKSPQWAPLPAGCDSCVSLALGSRGERLPPEKARLLTRFSFAQPSSIFFSSVHRVPCVVRHSTSRSDHLLAVVSPSCRDAFLFPPPGQTRRSLGRVG